MNKNVNYVTKDINSPNVSQACSIFEVVLLKEYAREFKFSIAKKTIFPTEKDQLLKGRIRWHESTKRTAK
ncbi:hypothetical protein BpHYR1_029020 [Brachionus plicatilis]|uniref:Uncharacterized protein n=1 Tax=Brachionus plicatilis TaxID=10195 RepID=A0A3M7SWJ0_BRAPC|nr:hypothetical protein BpHYR1_029020 [Brachionus plicatilis]